MLRRPLIALALLLAIPVAVSAQDEMPDDLCSVEGVVYVTSYLEQVLEVLRNGGDADNALLGAQILIASYRSDCAGRVFTSDEYGTDVVTDPIAFQSGFYRVTLESPGFASASLKALSGECGFLVLMVTNGGRDQASATLDACLAVVDAGGSDGWTLTFEPIALAE